MTAINLTPKDPNDQAEASWGKCAQNPDSVQNSQTSGCFGKVLNLQGHNKVYRVFRPGSNNGQRYGWFKPLAWLESICSSFISISWEIPIRLIWGDVRLHPPRSLTLSFLSRLMTTQSCLAISGDPGRLDELQIWNVQLLIGQMREALIKTDRSRFGRPTGLKNEKMNVRWCHPL